MSSPLFHTFPNAEPKNTITHGKGPFIFDKSGRQFLDLTAGFTGHAIIGWGIESVEEKIINQVKNIGHIDYKMFKDDNREALARNILNKCNAELTRVFFAGGSGAEACETAVNLSYQVHCESGNPDKTVYISREQSYHGATSSAMSLGDRPNLNFFAPQFPAGREKIKEHNPFRCKFDGESDVQYEDRCLEEFRRKIIEIGPERIGGFVGETVMGGLVGDVPPTSNYWKKVRTLCSTFNIHLILDEVWCGGGTSGKFLCCDWDGITPDFVFCGKTIAGGYQALSLVLTNEAIHSAIMNGSKRVENSTTFQGHSVAVAAGLAVQEYIDAHGLLENAVKLGERLRACINQRLKDSEYFYNVRGRGVRNSIEYRCPDQHLFGMELATRMLKRHNIFISGKWHRISLTPPLNIEPTIFDTALNNIIDEFISLEAEWEELNKASIETKNFF